MCIAAIRGAFNEDTSLVRLVSCILQLHGTDAFVRSMGKSAEGSCSGEKTVTLSAALGTFWCSVGAKIEVTTLPSIFAVYVQTCA
jgi:hypothetical protein